MAYTTFAQVQEDFKDMAFTSTSNVRDTDVTQFIKEHDALINAKVGQVYVVPITTGEGLDLMSLLSRSLTAARIKRIMEVKQEKSIDANQNVVSTLLTPKEVMKILDDISKKNMVLDGGVLLSSTGGFSNGNNNRGVKPVVRKDIKQW